MMRTLFLFPMETIRPRCDSNLDVRESLPTRTGTKGKLFVDPDGADPEVNAACSRKNISNIK